MLLQQLLREDGSIWISIDDNEVAYLRVLCDEVFGRSNFVTTIIWEKRKNRENRRAFSFKNDKLPVYQVNPEYTFEMMCEAICKLEGFRYKPDGNFHGYSSEKRFIHITKEFVNAEYIMSVATTLGEDQSLLIYGTKIQSDLRLPENIEVKKIPKDLLEKCDFESEVR